VLQLQPWYTVEICVWSHDLQAEGTPALLVFIRIPKETSAIDQTKSIIRGLVHVRGSGKQKHNPHFMQMVINHT